MGNAAAPQRPVTNIVILDRNDVDVAAATSSMGVMFA
jgi:hypothetical protein